MKMMEKKGIDQNVNMKMTDKKGQTTVKCENDHMVADFETAVADTGYGVFNYLLLVSALFSGLSHQSNTQMMSYLLPSAECDLELTPFNKGTLNAAPYIGGICGSIMWGFLSDTYGRRNLLVLSYALDGLFSLIASLSQTFWFLLMIRIFNGFIICGPMAMQKTFLAEYHGFQYRSRVMMATGFSVAAATICIPMIAWAVIPLPWSWQLFGGTFTYNSWRIFVAVCSIPSFAAALIFYMFDETPKFLMSHRQEDKALSILQKMYKLNTGKDPNSYPVKALKGSEIRAPRTSVGSQLKAELFGMLREGWMQCKPLFLKPHRPNAILIAGIQFLTLYGMNTLRLWLPQIFASIEEYNLHQRATNQTSNGASLCEIISFTSVDNNTVKIESHCSAAMVENQVYINSMIVGATSGIVFLVACYFINVVNKKFLLVFAFLVSGASGIAIYWSRDDVTTLSLSSLYVAVLNVTHIICLTVAVELFPTSVRNMAVSLTLMMGQLGSIIGNITFPILLEINCVVPFILIGSIVLGCALLSLLVPKTKLLD